MGKKDWVNMGILNHLIKNRSTPNKVTTLFVSFIAVTKIYHNFVSFMFFAVTPLNGKLHEVKNLTSVFTIIFSGINTILSINFLHNIEYISE